MSRSREIKDAAPSENSELSQEDKKYCRQSADFILEITQYSSYSILAAVTRMYSFLDSPGRDTNACKALIKKYISEYQNPRLKQIEKVIHAALIHFDFVDSLHSRKKVATDHDVHVALLAALNNENLTLYFANNLYRSCYKETSFTRDPANENLKSRAWQNTMQIINNIALKKLKDELRGMDPADQLALLEYARRRPIFNEHISNYIFTGAFGRTSPIQQIDLMINELKVAHPEIQFSARGYSING